MKNFHEKFHCEYHKVLLLRNLFKYSTDLMLCYRKTSSVSSWKALSRIIYNQYVQILFALDITLILSFIVDGTLFTNLLQQYVSSSSTCKLITDVLKRMELDSIQRYMSVLERACCINQFRSLN